jgi:hypothetical protein
MSIHFTSIKVALLSWVGVTRAVLGDFRLEIGTPLVQSP